MRRQYAWYLRRLTVLDEMVALQSKEEMNARLLGKLGWN